jgi:hypothetical protein
MSGKIISTVQGAGAPGGGGGGGGGERELEVFSAAFLAGTNSGVLRAMRSTGCNRSNGSKSPRSQLHVVFYSGRAATGVGEGSGEGGGRGKGEWSDVGGRVRGDDERQENNADAGGGGDGRGGGGEDSCGGQERPDGALEAMFDVQVGKWDLTLAAPDIWKTQSLTQRIRLPETSRCWDTSTLSNLCILLAVTCFSGQSRGADERGGGREKGGGGEGRVGGESHRGGVGDGGIREDEGCLREWVVVVLESSWDWRDGAGVQEIDSQSVAMQRYFLSAGEERLLRLPEVPSAPNYKRLPSFAQPVNISGEVLAGVSPYALRSDDSLCVRWVENQKKDHEENDDKDDEVKCRFDSKVQYTRVVRCARTNYIFYSCFDPDLRHTPHTEGCPTIHVSGGCKVQDDDDFDSIPMPVLYLDGPTFIINRTPHFPHFLEEISHALTWLARENMSYFDHVLVTDGGGACVSFNSYVPGLWAPKGSPLQNTLQFLMLQTISKGIVFTWGLRPQRTGRI